MSDKPPTDTSNDTPGRRTITLSGREVEIIRRLIDQESFADITKSMSITENSGQFYIDLLKKKLS